MLTFLFLLFLSSNGQLLKVEVEEHSLDNGLKILLHKNDNNPSVTCRLFYKTGSVNEYPGVSGVSHMFEHMMFKGTRTIGVTEWSKDSLLLPEIDKAYAEYDSLKRHSADSSTIRSAYSRLQRLIKEEKKYIKKDELWDLYRQNGGAGLNAFTSDIMTAYYVTLPKNKIELFFWLESDRMMNAVMREFYTERDVVAEERRMRYENRPIGRYWESLYAMFWEAHPYRNPTIGWMSDIQHFNKQMLKERFDMYYRPDNVVLVLAGDIDEAQVLSLAKKYFGRIPKGKKPIPPITIKEPKQIGEKRFIAYRDASPRIDMLFHVPDVTHDDSYVLDVVSNILSGREGRLYKRLVKKLDLCVGAGAENQWQKYTGVFHVKSTLKKGTNPDTVEHILNEELNKLMTGEISDFELEKVKNTISMAQVNNLREMERLATMLGYWETMSKWQDINTSFEKIMRVTKQDVKSAATKYFTQENRTVGILLNREKN